MKKLNRKLWVALSLLLVTSLTGMVSCGKKPGSDTEPSPTTTEEKKDAGTEAPTGGTTAAAPTPAAGVGTIKGKINFTGTAPDAPELNRQADPFCSETKMKAQEIVVNENKTLKNVAIRVIGAKGGEGSKIEVDQKNCMYDPRVLVTVDGQSVAIKNGDPTLHNVHTYAGTKTLFNRAQPKGAPAFDHTFKKEEGEIVKFKCDVHPWMTGWLLVSDNGFNAVTSDSGEFEIKNVPAGTYTLKTFHEQFGEKEAQVKVEADKTAEVNFDYAGTEKAAFKYREVTFGMNHEGH